MGYQSWIMSFIQDHEGEPIAEVIQAIWDKEVKDKEYIPIEMLSIFVDYCNYYM